MMLENWWHKKEMPFRGWTGFGGGAFGLAFKSAGGIDASGGDTEGEYDSGGDTYKYHKFTSSGSFVVNSCPDEAEIEYLIALMASSLDNSILFFIHSHYALS